MRDPALKRYDRHLKRDTIPRTADVNHRLVVGAEGLGKLSVKSGQDGNPYTVRVHETKAPGAFLPTARHVGTPGEVGLPTSAPGRRGAFDPISRDTSIGGGQTVVCPAGFLGVVRFINLFSLDETITGGDAADPDTINIPYGAGTFDVQVVPFGDGCFPTDTKAFMEEIPDVGGTWTPGSHTFGTPHTLWSLGSSEVLVNGNLLLSSVQAVWLINPTMDSYDGGIRLYSLSQGNLGVFYHPLMIGETGPNRVKLEI